MLLKSKHSKFEKGISEDPERINDLIKIGDTEFSCRCPNPSVTQLCRFSNVQKLLCFIH